MKRLLFLSWNQDTPEGVEYRAASRPFGTTDRVVHDWTTNRWFFLGDWYPQEFFPKDFRVVFVPEEDLRDIETLIAMGFSDAKIYFRYKLWRK